MWTRYLNLILIFDSFELKNIFIWSKNDIWNEKIKLYLLGVVCWCYRVFEQDENVSTKIWNLFYLNQVNVVIWKGKVLFKLPKCFIWTTIWLFWNVLHSHYQLKSVWIFVIWKRYLNATKTFDLFEQQISLFEVKIVLWN